MVVVIVLVSGISAGLLTTINICTKDRIARNKEIKLKKSVLNVFGVPYEKDGIIDVFGKKVETGDLDGRPFYRYYEGGKVSGVAFEIKGAGFWGPISALVALEPDLGAIKGVEILHQEETPGLGGRITEEEFRSQFKGRSTRPEISVDAITGATMTSKAFKKIINENVKSFKDEFRKK